MDNLQIHSTIRIDTASQLQQRDLACTISQYSVHVHHLEGVARLLYGLPLNGTFQSPIHSNKTPQAVIPVTLSINSNTKLVGFTN